MKAVGILCVKLTVSNSVVLLFRLGLGFQPCQKRSSASAVHSYEFAICLLLNASCCNALRVYCRGNLSEDEEKKMGSFLGGSALTLAGLSVSCQDITLVDR